ncbi:hypothetical protein [Micromonospora tulbaghiae]|uniref:hypothetical protein n=1 Tax=Micromonospora tulbaghiae TaxID=479978 RepID=UPI0013C521F8|nr:hypothetical protein [Micromonospora tulbaghiae]
METERRDLSPEVVRVRLVVVLERIGPIHKDRSTVVTALRRLLCRQHTLWAGTDIKQTAYRVVSIEEEETSDAG